MQRQLPRNDRSFAHAASEVGSRRGSLQSSIAPSAVQGSPRGRRGDRTRSMVSSVSASSRGSASTGMTSLRHRSRRGLGDGDESSAASEARATDLRRKYDAETDRLRLQQEKLLDMEMMLANMRAKCRLTDEAREKMVASLTEKRVELDKRTVELQQQMVVKEALIQDNIVHIYELNRIVNLDRVKMAWNFIARFYCYDLEGIAPEEVFSPELLARIRINRDRKDRARTVEAKIRTKLASGVAVIALFSVISLSISNSLAEKFRRAVLASVGVKAGDMGGVGWFAQEQEVAPQMHKVVVKALGQEKIPKIPTRPKYQEHPHAHRYRLPTALEKHRRQMQKTKCSELQAAQQELQTLLAADRPQGRLESTEQYLLRLAAERDLAFERERAVPRSPSPDPFLWAHLPPTIARRSSMSGALRGDLACGPTRPDSPSGMRFFPLCS
eukprot:TRINITY_DN867_c1_g1_i1.p1 TRINITY_DN867_c1_g1~~TRINITY_DN867_c1_g1_i1.p1  ORF type:complete len:442 (+),score=137.10 TRINITY_DN867_c1_g1_i1:93-1418(+)